MKRTVLKWSCNRRKFESIIIDGLTENLGRANGTTWKLKISSENKQVLIPQTMPLAMAVNLAPRYSYCPYPFWTFELDRSVIGDELKVTTKVISNNKVWNNVVNFSADQTSSKILQCFEVEGLVDYRLVFCLILESDGETDEIIKEEFQMVKLQHLSSGLQTMFKKEHMTDIALKCGSVVLKAHKNILSCQSSVFDAMFASPMLEKKMDTVVIKDIDPSVLQVMVNFLYSGQVKLDSESMTYDLLYAAEKYQIEPLKEGCIEHLKEILSHENALRILEISNLFDRQLKLQCLSFISNNFEEFKSTREWKDLKLKNPVLAIEIYQCISNETDD